MALLALLLGGCTGDGGRPTLGASPPPSPPPTEAGLARVMGQDARALDALFGHAELDLKEGPARKLQYRGAACTLDAYLYPPPGGGTARVSWIDARTPRGDEFDRASCIAALVRRPPIRR